MEEGSGLICESVDKKVIGILTDISIILALFFIFFIPFH